MNLSDKLIFAHKIIDFLKSESSEINILPHVTMLEKIVVNLEKKMNRVKDLNKNLEIKSIELREMEIQLDNLLNRIDDFSIKLSFNEY
jgi:hypothetical protein